jgi:hypothetical protein
VGTYEVHTNGAHENDNNTTPIFIEINKKKNRGATRRR